MKRIASAIILSVALIGTGCKTVTTGPQPTASTPYQKAAVVMLDFSQDLLSAQKVEINLHAGGVIDNPTHRTIQGYFKQIDGYGTQINALLSAQASASTIQAKVNAALVSLNAITSATSGLDANTKTQIAASVSLLQGVFNNVMTQFNAATTEVDFGPIDNRSIGRAGRGTSLADLQPGEAELYGGDEAAGRDSRRS